MKSLLEARSGPKMDSSSANALQEPEMPTEVAEDNDTAPKPEASKPCPESDVQAMVAEVLEEEAEEEKSEDAAADEPMAMATKPPKRKLTWIELWQTGDAKRICAAINGMKLRINKAAISMPPSSNLPCIKSPNSKPASSVGKSLIPVILTQ